MTRKRLYQIIDEVLERWHWCLTKDQLTVEFFGDTIVLGNTKFTKIGKRRWAGDMEEFVRIHDIYFISGKNWAERKQTAMAKYQKWFEEYKPKNR